MSRLVPLIVILVFLGALPVARAQEVKTFDCAAYGTDCDSAIPDTGPGTLTSVITVPAGLNPNCVIADLDVSIVIEHTWREDVDVTLEGPDGTSVELWTDVDFNQDNFFVIIDDEAATEIQLDPGCAGGTYCFGKFAPEAPASLADFDGLNPAGDWALTVVDDFAGDSGSLRGWSLRMTFADTDGDAVFDCDDLCPSDAAKSAPGVCGCGTADTNTDGDALADCVDACPNDAANDVDNDGVCGDLDNCPAVYNPAQADANGDGIGTACDPNPCGVSVAGATIFAMCALCALKLASRRRRARR